MVWVLLFLGFLGSLVPNIQLPKVTIATLCFLAVFPGGVADQRSPACAGEPPGVETGSGVTGDSGEQGVKPAGKEKRTGSATVQADGEMRVSTGTTSREPGIGVDFVWVPGGCFRMGSPVEKDHQDDESPEHEVCVDGFWMGKTEVTVGQFRLFVSETNYLTEAERDVGVPGCSALKPDMTGWEYQDGRDWRNPGFSQQETFPVACVGWKDVAEYLAWAQRKTGKKVALPTEAQWEYAARAGTTTSRYWGDDPSQACGYANVADQTNDVMNWKSKHECRDGFTFASPVGSFKPNAFGLYDMLGNVWEWCADYYGYEYYGHSPRDNPTGLNLGWIRVSRGGNWGVGPDQVRSADRRGRSPAIRGVRLGFRLVHAGDLH